MSCPYFSNKNKDIILPSKNEILCPRFYAADYGHHPAGKLAFRPVGEKGVGVAAGADSQIVNILREYAGCLELDSQGFGHVEEKFARLPRWFNGYVLSGIHILEKKGNFRAYFITARSYAGSHCNEETGGIAPENIPHLQDCFGRNLLQCAPPTRMNGRNGAVVGIRYQDRQAIGGFYGNRNALSRCNKSIALQRIPLYIQKTGHFFYYMYAF